MRRALLAAIAGLALGSCGARAESVPPAPSGAETCDPHAFVGVNGGEYLIETNEWNSHEPQCIAVHGDGFAVTRADFGLPAQGPPATYPAIFRGCHWGTCSKHSGLPAPVAALPAVTTSWVVDVPGGGAYDAAYDIWFNKTPTTSGAPDGAELMVWLDHGGGVGSAGKQTGTVSLSGATWDVWQGPMGGWKYIAYVRTEPTHAVRDLDIVAFTRDAIARGAVDPAWYLIDVEAGFEVWQGGRGLASRSFSVSVEPGR
jgi:cellulose 1,4-beta-cellobiosidase